MTEKSQPQNLRFPTQRPELKKLEEHVLMAFRQEFEDWLERVQESFESPPSHEDPQNPESVEGQIIRDIYTTAERMMAEIDSPKSKRGPDIWTLINRAVNIGYEFGRLSSARYLRGLLGREDYTLKAALIEAIYYSKIGKELHPKIEQEELKRIQKKEQALDAQRQAGKDSHGLTKEERNERNDYLQEEINNLCLVKNLGYIKASEQIEEYLSGEKWQLSARRIREHTTNPLKE
jgi:hypothetical protein